jgi:uncharacterized membrane protein
MKLSLKNNQGQKNFKKSQRTLKNIIALLITQDIFRGFLITVIVWQQSVHNFRACAVPVICFLENSIVLHALKALT